MQWGFGLHRRLGRGAALQRYRSLRQTTLSFSISDLPLGLLQHIHAVMTRACIHVSVNVPIGELDLKLFRKRFTLKPRIGKQILMTLENLDKESADHVDRTGGKRKPH